MKILLLLALIILVLLVVSYGIARYLVYFILNRNAKHQESTDSMSKDPEEVKLAIRILCGDDEWKTKFHEMAEIWYINSFDSLKLCGFFLQNNSHKYAILCHGFTGTHRQMVGIAEHFYRKGFSILAPDARAHGDSEGTYRGMGYLERDDVKKWIQKIVDMDSEAKIVLYGQSMGAATVMMTASEPLVPQVKCVIQDCGYISVWDEFAGQLKILYRLPSFPIMNFANEISKRKAGYSFKDASPLDLIQNCRLPILMIHGEEDTFVPHAYLKQLYEKANEPKQYLSIAKAGHCMSIAKENELYWKTVDTFIEKYFCGK